MITAIILASGQGKRMGETILPKQFLKIYGTPLIIYSLETFNKNSNIDEIIVVTSKEYLNEVKALCASYCLNKTENIIEGGDSRQKSVQNALNYLKSKGIKDKDIVLIHDSARPLVSEEIINDNIKMCQKYEAVTTVIDAQDTIVYSEDKNTITNTPNRDNLYLVQTPQTFTFGLIYEAHKKAREESYLNSTDDAQLVQKMNHKIYLVKGNKNNFKITTKEDLLYLETILKRKEN